MLRLVPGILVVLFLLLPAPTVRADILGKVVEQVAFELGQEAAQVLIDVAIANTSQKYSAAVVAVSAERFDSNAYLAFCQPMKVKMRAGSQGKTIFYDEENANHTLMLDVEVEMVALYPLAQVRYQNGEIKLPTPRLVPGYAREKGDRGTWNYKAGSLVLGWSQDYQAKVAAQLQIDALDAAKEEFKKSYQATLEYQFKQGVAPELRRLAAAEKQFLELNKKP